MFLQTTKYNTQYLVNDEYYQIIKKSNLKDSKPDRTKRIRTQKHFELFLNKYNIKEGNNYIKSSALYFLADPKSQILRT
jgi:hypothetical protein